MTKATQDFHGWHMRESMEFVRYRSMSESFMVEE